MNKIIVVDNHSIYRESVKLLVENEKLGIVIGEANDGNQLLHLLLKQRPDVVIMDIEMPVDNGLKSIKSALQLLPELRILILTMISDKVDHVSFMNAGAKGCIHKTTGKQILEEAIIAVTNNEYYFPKLLH